MDHTQILLRPVVTEKATFLRDGANQVAFFVHPDANKIEIKKAIEENAELKKQVGDYLKEKVQQLKKDLIAKAVERNGVKVVVFRGEANVDAIKDLAFQIKGESNTDEKVFFVAGIKDGEKCALMVMLSEQLVSEGLNAGKLVKDAAKLIQGGGGGQPHFATAGGKNVAGLGEAVEHILDAAGLK